MPRLHRRSFRALLEEIASGETPAGERLPREVDLVARFGVSRGVVRETMRALEERGLVEVRHGRGGALVLPEDRWSLVDADVLGARLTYASSAALLAELHDARRLLEGHAAALAAERATGPDVRALTDALSEMRVAGRGRRRAEPSEDAFVIAEQSFNRRVLAVARNRPIVRMLEPLQAGLSVALHPHLAGREEQVEGHRDAILSAIAARDPEAARAAVEMLVSDVAGWLDDRSGST